jgi:hypothetical protein
MLAIPKLKNTLVILYYYQANSEKEFPEFYASKEQSLKLVNKIYSKSPEKRVRTLDEVQKIIETAFN